MYKSMKFVMILLTARYSHVVIAERKNGRVPIAVFWDIENCSVPRGVSALGLVRRLREELFAGHLEAEFMCVCDTRKENKKVIQDLNAAQVCPFSLIAEFACGIFFRFKRNAKIRVNRITSKSKVVI